MPSSRHVSTTTTLHRSTTPLTAPIASLHLDDFEWDKEDEASFEVPDFHFDWGVAKEKNGERAQDGSHGSSSDSSRQPLVIASPEERHRNSVDHPRTSIGSSRVSGSHSSSSLSRASPGWNEPAGRQDLTDQRRKGLSSMGTINSGESGHFAGVHGKRPFSRVVSAPVQQEKIYNGSSTVSKPSCYAHGCRRTIRLHMLNLLLCVHIYLCPIQLLSTQQKTILLQALRIGS